MYLKHFLTKSNKIDFNSLTNIILLLKALFNINYFKFILFIL